MQEEGDGKMRKLIKGRLIPQQDENGTFTWPRVKWETKVENPQRSKNRKKNKMAKKSRRRNRR